MALDISKEENPKTKTKLNFKVWIKILKYTFKRWPLLIILLLTILITSFYDVSFIPLMNAAAINTLTELNGNFVPLNELLFQMNVNLVCINKNFRPTRIPKDICEKIK